MASLLFLGWCCVLLHLMGGPYLGGLAFSILLSCGAAFAFSSFLFGGAALPPPVWWLCFHLLALGGSCCSLLSVWVVLLSPLPSLAWSCIPSSSSFWAVLLGLILLVVLPSPSPLWLVHLSPPPPCGWCCLPSLISQKIQNECNSIQHM